MKYHADYLIERRRARWEESKSIERDKELRCAIADRLLEDESLLEEVKRYPEKLIELVFVVVDKNQKTMPFFLNEVQKSFMNTLNQAIEEFREGRDRKSVV